MNIYDFSVDKINGEFTSSQRIRGKVILIVNSATDADLPHSMMN